MRRLDPVATRSTVDEYWERGALDVLSDYVTIPCLSPDFDPDWESNGEMMKAAALLADWARSRPLGDHAVEIVTLPGRTPCLLVEVGASPGREGGRPALIYGHLDKQPPLGEWREGLGPYMPVREGDRLYGRGSVDDGYALFAAIGALETLSRAEVAHGRVLVLIESSEESASEDLAAYLEDLEPRFGDLALICCLDSGGPSYDRLWTTTSLRGLVDAVLRIEVLTDAIHSGIGAGVVPSSFRVLRELLDRIDDTATGDVRLQQAWVDIPPERAKEMDALAESGLSEVQSLPIVDGLRLEADDVRGLIERGTWHAGLEVTGADGLPRIVDAGNLYRAQTTVKLSLRIPPTADASAVAAALERTLTTDPPQGARVTFTPGHAAQGWSAPAIAPWLAEAVAEASESYYGQTPCGYGVGGSIPFMAALGVKYANAQFFSTGALGADSNAHGINESLHIPTVKSLTASIAEVLAAFAAETSS
jgi:acetylornithine deacetylase/succinyl-diaminopimelate desuccinylase-like protein